MRVCEKCGDKMGLFAARRKDADGKLVCESCRQGYPVQKGVTGSVHLANHTWVMGPDGEMLLEPARYAIAATNSQGTWVRAHDHVCLIREAVGDKCIFCQHDIFKTDDEKPMWVHTLTGNAKGVEGHAATPAIEHTADLSMDQIQRHLTGPGTSTPSAVRDDVLGDVADYGGMEIADLPESIRALGPRVFEVERTRALYDLKEQGFTSGEAACILNNGYLMPEMAESEKGKALVADVASNPNWDPRTASSFMDRMGPSKGLGPDAYKSVEPELLNLDWHTLPGTPGDPIDPDVEVGKWFFVDYNGDRSHAHEILISYDDISNAFHWNAVFHNNWPGAPKFPDLYDPGDMDGSAPTLERAKADAAAFIRDTWNKKVKLHPHGPNQLRMGFGSKSANYPGLTESTAFYIADSNDAIIAGPYTVRDTAVWALSTGVYPEGSTVVEGPSFEDEAGWHTAPMGFRDPAYASKTATPLTDGLDTVLGGLDAMVRQAKEFDPSSMPENSIYGGSDTLSKGWAETLEGVVAALRRAAADGLETQVLHFAGQMLEKAYRQTGSLQYGMPGAMAECRAAISYLLANRPGWLSQYQHTASLVLTSKKEASIQVIAHDSGDGQTIYHCPFCGSGNVIGRGDGTVECGYCHNAFTVQVQPQHPNMPQTNPATGDPMPVPGMPGKIDRAEPGGPLPPDQTKGEQPRPPESSGPPKPPGAGKGGPPKPEGEDKPKGDTPPQFEKASGKVASAESDFVQRGWPMDAARQEIWDQWIAAGGPDSGYATVETFAANYSKGKTASVDDLQGKTVHVLRNTKYMGAFEKAYIEPHDDPRYEGWYTINDGEGGGQYFAREEDMFDSKEAAQAEASARRKPRGPNKVPQVAGEMGMAMMLSNPKTNPAIAFKTHEGHALDEETYLRHLAIRHAEPEDIGRVLAQVRLEQQE